MIVDKIKCMSVGKMYSTYSLGDYNKNHSVLEVTL